MSDIILADNLAALSNVRHAFFTRGFGNPGLSRDDPKGDALKTRAMMANHLGAADEKLLVCQQVHSPDVVTVDRVWQASESPQADALVTNQVGISIGVLTADCVPVLFADMRAGVIGAAHAGWRGALTGVLENAVAAMEKLGARPRNIFAGLGPCIWQKSYEVGPEFPAPFLAEAPEHEKFFRPSFKSDRYMFDLPGYVVAKLRTIGVGSVEGSSADTCADPDKFYSHRYTTLRGEKREGNLMSAIALKSD